MSWSRGLKICAIWLGCSLSVGGYWLYTQPMAGGVLALAALSLMTIVLGAPTQIFLSYKNPLWSNMTAFIMTLMIIFMGFIAIGASGVFNFT